MKRRGFFGALVAAPFVAAAGIAQAKEESAGNVEEREQIANSITYSGQSMHINSPSKPITKKYRIDPKCFVEVTK